jgi:3-phosphoshikimate 1-carboxyvinyltransferase
VKLPNADLLITGKKLQSKTIFVDEIESSQFVSALMLISPFIDGKLKYCIKARTSSFSYIELTQNIIDKVLTNKKDAATCVERDWTSASYFFAALAISQTKERVLFRDLKLNSLQNDAILAKLMANFGVETQECEEGIVAYFDVNQYKKVENFEFNFRENIDLTPTFMVLCQIKGIETKFSGIEALRYKESDRLSALSHISSQSKKALSTFDDHRLAMAFALFILKFPDIEIENPQVVSKSFPDFWKEFEKICHITSIQKNDN